MRGYILHCGLHTQAPQTQRAAQRPNRHLMRAMLTGATLMLLGLFFAPAAPALGEEIMTPATALARAEAGSVLLVDVRRPREWRDTGVAVPAREVTMHQETGPRGFLADMVAAVGGDKSMPVALICASGVRTSWASRFLSANGFSEVYNVKEGMLGRGGDTGWIKRGLPTRPCESCGD